MKAALLSFITAITALIVCLTTGDDDMAAIGAWAFTTFLAVGCLMAVAHSFRAGTAT